MRSKLRAANVLDLNDVKAAVLESTGDISILQHKDRNKILNNYLMEGVKIS